MVKLRTLEGKKIRLTDFDDNVFEGYVGDYIYPDDNEPEGIEGIVLDYPIRKSDNYKYENLIEFDAPDIKSIEIIA